MIAALVLALAVVASVLGGLALYTQDQVRRAERAFPPVGRFLSVDGTRLHYVEQGAGPTVVALHGAFGTLLDFPAPFLHGVARSFRVLALDRPGHGYSERPAAGLETLGDQARWLHVALQRLHVTQPIFVGHSWSGALALRYAVDYPGDVKAVVVAAGVIWPDEMATPPPFGQTLTAPGVRDLVAHTLLLPIGRLRGPAALTRAFSPAPVPDAYAAAALALALRPTQFRANAEDLRVLGEGLPALRGRYPDLAVPVAVLVGEADALTPPGTHAVPFVAAVSRAALTILPGAGHQLTHTHPKALVEAIQAVAGSRSAGDRAPAAGTWPSLAAGPVWGERTSGR